MADDEWDADDFVPPVPNVAPALTVKSDRWEGEDEEEPVKESWEDEEVDDKKDSKTTSTQPGKKKSSKKLEEKIAEKEKKEAEKRRKAEEERLENLTPEERMAEKLRRQKLVEEADLELAKETFGFSDKVLREGSIDDAEPHSKEGFLELKNNLIKKLQSLSSREFYNDFAEELIKDLCVGHRRTVEL
nr:EOG090X0OQM [Cyclestheria hislopi]